MKEHFLVDCRSGASGVVSRVGADSFLAARLQELGILPGVWIRVVRSGDPVILQIGDSRFCVRARDLRGFSLYLYDGDSDDAGYSAIFPSELSPAPAEPALSMTGASEPSWGNSSNLQL
ncbi:MAG: FeoA family protein [Candidatus Omnitrophota bacterium]